MTSKIEGIHDSFIQTAGDLSATLGLSRTAGQLYGLLFLSGKPVSIRIMAKTLGVSLGSVSLNIRALEEWGAVKKVWVKGSRKDFYEANLDTLNVIAKRARVAIKKRMDIAAGTLERNKSEIARMNGKNLTKEEKELLSVYKDRFSRIEKMKDMVVMVLNHIPEQI